MLTQHIYSPSNRESRGCVVFVDSVCIYLIEESRFGALQHRQLFAAPDESVL